MPPSREGCQRKRLDLLGASPLPSLPRLVQRTMFVVGRDPKHHRPNRRIVGVFGKRPHLLGSPVPMGRAFEQIAIIGTVLAPVPKSDCHAGSGCAKTRYYRASGQNYVTTSQRANKKGAPKAASLTAPMILALSPRAVAMLRVALHAIRFPGLHVVPRSLRQNLQLYRSRKFLRRFRVSYRLIGRCSSPSTGSNAHGATRRRRRRRA
jgi:hypothetical protein